MFRLHRDRRKTDVDRVEEPEDDAEEPDGQRGRRLWIISGKIDLAIFHLIVEVRSVIIHGTDRVIQSGLFENPVCRVSSQL